MCNKTDKLILFIAYVPTHITNHSCVLFIRVDSIPFRCTHIDVVEFFPEVQWSDDLYRLAAREELHDEIVGDAQAQGDAEFLVVVDKNLLRVVYGG